MSNRTQSQAWEYIRLETDKIRDFFWSLEKTSYLCNVESMFDYAVKIPSECLGEHELMMEI